MSPKLRVPAIVFHRGSGRSVVFLRAADGKRRMIYLRGEPGSAEEQRHYREILADHLAGKPVATAATPKRVASEWPTVGQVVASFLLWAEKYYVDAAGNRSREVDNFSLSFRPLLALLRDLPSDRITIRDMGNVRQFAIDTEFGHQRDKVTKKIIPGTGRKRCRKYVNAMVRRMKHLLRWGVEQKFVPGSVWHEVSAMRGLPIGRAGVRESESVVAVPWSMVEPVLLHLPTPLRACVELQWWSGMRPSEALTLRTCDIDRHEKVWAYRPEQHKGRWRGKERVVRLGPKAQDLLRPLLKADPKAFLISPRDVIAEVKAAKRASRKTPPTKQMRDRDARAAGMPPDVGGRYDVNAYRRAIHNACDKADVPRWSPHRLRHAAGTRLVLKEGIEAARVALGHADDSITRRYAVAADSQLAAEVMAKHG
jgi:integrase